ncbi:hypothetical protein OF001_U30091 [Pseudomonas sp. OF001]|nr:hypothetical protein OF001_U30091 [Pseudomonas sp. OF001]
MSSHELGIRNSDLPFYSLNQPDLHFQKQLYSMPSTKYYRIHYFIWIKPFGDDISAHCVNSTLEPSSVVAGLRPSVLSYACIQPYVFTP